MWQGTDPNTFIIYPGAYQQHFYVYNNAAFQLVGVTLNGPPPEPKYVTGGGVIVNGIQCSLGTQDVVLANTYYGPAVAVYSAQNVHVR